MASVQDCDRALRVLADRLAALDPEVRRQHVVERTVSCRVPDLDVVFLARLDPAGLVDLRCEPVDQVPAQIRLTADSDDLLALLEGRLGVPAAWATGRLRVHASVLDLLRLRSLL